MAIIVLAAARSIIAQSQTITKLEPELREELRQRWAALARNDAKAYGVRSKNRNPYFNAYAPDTPPPCQSEWRATPGEGVGGSPYYVTLSRIEC